MIGGRVVCGGFGELLSHGSLELKDELNIKMHLPKSHSRKILYQYLLFFLLITMFSSSN